MKGKVEYLSSQDIYFYHLDAKDRSEEAKKLKTLFKLAKGEKVINGTYRTLVTPIPSSDIHNSFVSMNEGTARPAQSVRFLDDLA